MSLGGGARRSSNTCSDCLEEFDEYIDLENPEREFVYYPVQAPKANML
jgi:hypothetical protein